MLVTFHSAAYENITYFGDIAQQLIRLMGHSGTVPGAIKSEDLPEALSLLLQGLASNKFNTSEHEDDEGMMEVDLAKRAIPLINLLKASIKMDCNVMWGD